MKSLFLLFILLPSVVCIAQNDFLKKVDHEIINKFYLKLGIVSENSSLADTLSYSSKIEVLFKVEKKSSNGVYLLIPPVEPYREYVMLFDDGCKILRSKNLEHDLPQILSFLSKYDKTSVKQFLPFLRRLIKTYQENNPLEGMPRKM
jgi:hypothetical protein